MSNPAFLNDILRIYRAAQASDDGQRCAVAPHPDLRARMVDAMRTMAESHGFNRTFVVKLAEPKAEGLNDGMIYPPEAFPAGTAPSVIRSAAADRAPLRGTLRVIVVLVDFSDKPMSQSANHFRELFFSQGVIPTKSVREYYQEVTNGLIDIQGDVVGPFRMPQTLAAYANGAAGLGNVLPNARTMARDAVIASDPSVNFTPYDNNGDGFVDAFIVIHAGAGGEVTGNSGDIWSHKWVLDGGARSVDSTKIFGYLTVPEDCKIGVCAHELGHLLFGFPDLYDTDGTSEGIGNWCLMAGGSWGGGGDTPAHPCAWCKANQGWVSVNAPTSNGVVTIQDVKTSHTIYRLSKDGAPGTEYFLVENRQKTGFDSSLPGDGLLIWHIDEAQSGNTDENHYKVALMQADGKRDMELHHSRGDAGDSYPGSSNNTTFNNTSTPNSKSYAGAITCVGVTGISASGPNMSANLQVKCVVKAKEVVKDHKDVIKDHKEVTKEIEKKDIIKDHKEIIKEHKEIVKDHKEIIKEGKELEKPIIDGPGKPITDKGGSLDKGPADHKVGDIPGGGGGRSGQEAIKTFDKPIKEKEFKEHKEKELHKEVIKDHKEIIKEKDFKEHEKPIFDHPGKPVIDKTGAFDKGPADFPGFPGGGGGGGGQQAAPKSIDKTVDKPIHDKPLKEKEFKEKDHKDIKDKDHKDIKDKDSKDIKDKDKDKDKEQKEKDFKEHKEIKEFKEQKEHKEFKEFKEKELKEFKEKDKDIEIPDLPGDGGGQLTQIEARIAAIEAALSGRGGGSAGASASAQPYIGQELRPDLSQSPYAAEGDKGDLKEQMKQGSATAKRAYDTKPQS